MHTAFYLTLIETTCLSCTVFDIASYLSKAANFNLPHLHVALRWGDPGRISWRSLASENQSTWAIVQHYYHDPTFSHFSRLTYDRETDREDTGLQHIYRASTASCSKIWAKISGKLFEVTGLKRIVKTASIFGQLGSFKVIKNGAI